MNLFNVLSIFLYWISICNGDFRIVGQFLLCHSNEQLIEIQQNDEASFNIFNILKKFEDEYNFIFLNNRSLVVYSLKGDIYTTTCEQKSNLMVPRTFSDCTVDLPIYQINDNKKHVFYMSKTGILRNTSTIADCDGEVEYFHFGKFTFKRINKISSIVEKRLSFKLKDLFPENNELKLDNLTLEDSSLTLADYYYQNFAKNKIFITVRDIIYYVFMILVVIFGVVSG